MASAKIRILQGIRQGKVGGGESVLLSLVEHLDKDIFEPVVLSFTDGPMVEQLRSMSVPVHVIYTEKPFDFSVWGRVKKLMQKERIQLVHAHGTRAASNMFYAAQQLGLPWIYTCHGWSFHPDQQPLIKRIRILGERFLTKKATQNVCVSFANRQTGVDLFGERFDPVVIQNSIDQRKFDPAKNFKDVRAEFNIDRDTILFSSIARFTWQKQPLVLIRAFATLCEKMPNCRLLMVGDGEEKDQAKVLIDNLKIADKVILETFRQDVPHLLAATDVFVLPSLWEGLPVALLEAMSMAKAIIASKVDGTAEVIEHNHNGVLIDTDHLQEHLAEAMIRLARDPAMRERLGRHAAQRIREHYDAGDMTRKNEELYQQLYSQWYAK